MGHIQNIQGTSASDAVRGDEILDLQDYALARISLGVLITDAQRHIIYANKGFEQLTGYSADELLGKNCSLLQGPETDPATLRLLKEKIHTGSQFRGEILNYRKNRNSFWNDLSITPIYSAQGELVRYIGVQCDITERKAAEAALRESEERFKSAAKATNDALWDWDLGSNRMWWNDGMRQLLGFSPGEVEPGFASWLNHVHPEDRKRVEQSIHAAIESSEESWMEEYSVLHVDGSYAKVMDRGFVIRDSKGKGLRMVGGLSNLTEKSRALEVLAKNAELMKIAGHVAKLGAWQVEFPGPQVFWSEEVYRLHEVDPSYKPNLESALNFFPPTSREILARALEAGNPYDLELDFITAKGRHLWVRTTCSVELKEDGTKRFYGIFQDITSQKMAKENLRVAAERLQLAVHAGKMGVWELDLVTGSVEWDDQMIRLYGKDPASLESGVERWNSSIHPVDMSIAESKYEKALYGNENSFEMEFRIFRKNDGALRYIQAAGTLIRSDSGQPLRMIGINWDITDRKQDEEEARKDLEIQSGIVKALQEITYTNLDLPSALNLMARRAQELSGSDGAVITLIDGAEMVYQASSGILADQKGFRFSYAGSFSGQVSQSGNVLLCDDSDFDPRVDQTACRDLGIHSLLAAPLRSGEEIIGVLKTVSVQPGAFSPRDVNNVQILAESLGTVIQQHRNAEQLRQSESQYRLLFRHNPHPMWAYDLSTLRFMEVNLAAIAHYGYTEEEFLGMTLRDIRPKEEISHFDQQHEELPKDQKNTGHWKHRKKNGEIIDVEISSDAILFDGKPARLVLAHDITERVRAEKELALVNRAQLLLSSCNEALIRTQEENALLKDICRIAVDIGGYKMAWVGYARNDEDKSIEPMTFAGNEAGYLSEVHLSWSEDKPLGRGPGGRAVRLGEPTYCEDIAIDEFFHGWRTVASSRGFRSVICLPLKEENKTFGLLVLYSSEVQQIKKNEIKLLQEMADNLAFGINSIRSHQEKMQLQNTMLKVATGISATTGTEFFKQLVHTMTDSLGACAGFVSRLLPGEPAKARPLASIINGEFQKNEDYFLSGTPSEKSREGKLCVFNKNVHEQFPAASWILKIDAQAYVGTPLRDSNGEIVGVMAVLFSQALEETDFIVSMLQIFGTRAASEIQRQQADALVSEQAALLDKAQDAILVRDLDHRITFWNKSAERLYGWTTEEVIGRSVLEILYRETEAYDFAFDQVFKKGEWMGELQQIGKNGEPIIVEGRWTLVKDESGQPKSVLAINTDITEKKKLEQQFLRAQRMESIGTLAGGIAHDLNNILTPILMCVDILKMGAPEKQRETMLDTISNSAQRGADMVGQVLSFARGVESKQVEVQPLEVIRDIEKIAQDTFPKNIRIQSTLSPDLWMVTGDPTQLHQVFLNLCVNARDAMPQGGTLVLTAENRTLDASYAASNIDASEGPYVALHVEDTGTGIKPEIIEKIFDPFFTTKELGRGTGLGLSSSLAILKSHHGFIRVYSEPGKGSRFSIFLPARTEGPLHFTEQTRELPRGTGETILIVDDELSIREITRQTLEDFDYQVMTASDGAEAVALYAEHRQTISVVLMDMMMPVMDGPAAIQVLMKLNPSVRIIATSGISLNGPLAKVAGDGVKDFLPKPYTLERLLNALRTILDDRKNSEENPWPSP